MRRNRGNTTLRRRRRAENPMHEFDRLPATLRHWLAGAVLPWRPKSVHRAYNRALRRTADEAQAIEELDRLQHRLITRDAQRIWGLSHPDAEVETSTALRSS